MKTSNVIVSILAYTGALVASPSHAAWFYPGVPYELPNGGRIIPGGYASSDSPFGYTWVVVRTNPDGSADRTFNGGGAIAIPIFHSYEFAWHVVVQADGKIVVVGSVEDPALPSCYGDCSTMTAVARLNADGTLDRTFNGTGHVVVSLGGAEALPQLPDIAYLKRFEVRADGGITLYGYPDTPSARINPDGTIDTTFATMLQPREYRASKVVAVEAYHAGLDHYFMTWEPGEIEALASGATIKGWVATGKRIKLYARPDSAASPTSPVCRYYIPPASGDSHFFGRGEEECTATAAAHPSFVLESAAFMHAALPQAGMCPPKTVPIYRLFNNRPDANHRYTTDKAVRDAMVAEGWVAEGDGQDRVAMCGPE